MLADLRRRVTATKWPDQLPGTTWEYGADISKVRELANYWQKKKYNWRAQEARINRYDQFTTQIDGQTIHFIHERSPRAEAVPLMLIHGWPGSILEFLALIEPLTHPKDSSTPAFTESSQKPVPAHDDLVAAHRNGAIRRGTSRPKIGYSPVQRIKDDGLTWHN